jgi:hypothetical protein
MKTSDIYIYHEGTARKGARGVGSFLYGFITHNVQACVKELHLSSYGYVGVNKNYIIIHL